MRVLLGPDTDDLRTLYAVPRTPWLRLNFVSTVDGAAQGPDGKSGGINNAADKAVFDTLRDLADAVVVGAGTARAEGYRPAAVPIVVVTRSGDVPQLLRGADAGPRPGGDLRGRPRPGRGPRRSSGTPTWSCSARTPSTSARCPAPWPDAGCRTCSARAARTWPATCSPPAWSTSCARRRCRGCSPAPRSGSPTGRHRRPAPAARPARGRRHAARPLARRRDRLEADDDPRASTSSVQGVGDEPLRVRVPTVDLLDQRGELRRRTGLLDRASHTVAPSWSSR